MEQACRENLPLMWLTGLETPDHSTFGLFWKENRKALRGLLKQSVHVAAKMNLIGMVLFAVDGTKIRAQASMKSGYHRKVLEKALAKVDASIQEMEEGMAESGRAGLESYGLPEELQDALRRKEEIKQHLEQLARANTGSLNPHEPEARVMKCSGKNIFGYNAQAVADSKAGIVVAEDVVTAENDHGLLSAMIERAAETIGQSSPTTLADKGYSAEEDLGEAAEKELDVLVNLPKNVAPPDGENPYHKSRFVYDPDRDCCVCPIGGVLRFQRKRKSKTGVQVRVYHCTGYKDCPMRSQCSKNKRGRTIEVGPHHQAVADQIQRQRDPAEKEKLKRRPVIIEPTFALIKEVLAFSKWSFRNQEGVHTQWALLCTTLNLRKSYSAWRRALLGYA